MVCTCSIAYMRAGIGIDRLVVCLSEYLPLRIVYRILSMSTIAVYFRVCFAKRSRIAMVSVMFVRLVLVFAAMPKKMALRSVSVFV